jgi:hypothetical protein
MKQQINEAYVKQTCVYLENQNKISVLAAPIPEKDGYWAGVDGSIFSFKQTKPKLLKPCNNGNGYMFVILSINGKNEKCYVSRLVASTFFQNPSELDSAGNLRDEVNHCDGDRSNNKLPNLEWCSAFENHEHARRVLRSEDFLASKFAAAYLASKAA